MRITTSLHPPLSPTSPSSPPGLSWRAQLSSIKVCRSLLPEAFLATAPSYILTMLSLGSRSSIRLTLICSALALLLSCQRTNAWYKQSTGPSYYSVGRASGLLSGIRRSPDIRRSEPENAGESAENMEDNFLNNFGSQRQGALLKSMALCVKDVSPNLHSCELLPDTSSTFQCKAQIYLSLDSSDCLNP
ncbi:LOW QUALITY PROTEIN: neuropeptide B [Leptodactylus fuscus]